MRKLLLVLWLIAPAILIAWHYGPGQRLTLLDAAAAAHARSQAAAAKDDWISVVDATSEALALLAKAEALEQPANNESTEPATSLSMSPLEATLTVEQASARIRAGNLLEGIAQLQDFLDVTADQKPLVSQREKARHELATGEYFAAWLMRLEGAASDEWQIQAEAARQNFRLLAETGSPAITISADKNLEATIRLQRMDLSELRALPLPKNCKCNGGNLSQKCRQQRECRNPGKGKKPGEKPGDAREQIKKEQKGAGVNSAGSGEAW